MASHTHRNGFDFAGRERRAAIALVHGALKLPCRLLHRIKADVECFFQTLAALIEAERFAIGPASCAAHALRKVTLGAAEVRRGVGTLARRFDLIVKGALDVVQSLRRQRLVCR